MISNKVKEKFEEFSKTIEPVTELSKFYDLDFSWLSLGFLDSFCNPMRGAKKLDAFEELIIGGVSSYIGIMAHACWQSFGVDIIVDIQEEGVLIGARNGDFIKTDEEVVIYIERELKRLITELPNKLPIFHDFSREITSQTNIISNFALSVFLGITPLGEGPWSKIKPKDFQENIEKVTRYLATTCVDSYAKFFPNEQLGQISEIYLCDLIFPPLLYSEDIPARRAVNSIFEYMDQYKIEKNQLLSFAKNLILFADEIMSFCGICFYAALTGNELDSAKISSINSKGGIIGVIRPVIVELREKLGLGKDILFSKDLSDTEKLELEKEIKLNLFPWLKINKEHICKNFSEENFKKLLLAISVFNFKSAVDVVDRIIENDPTDIEVRIQRVYFDIIASDLDMAKKRIKELSTELESENHPAFYNMLGMIELLSNNSKEAINSFSKARTFLSGNSNLNVEVPNNYAWALMTEKKYDDALNCLDLALGRNPQNLTLLLNKLSCLLDLKKTTQAEALLRQLLEISPYDNRVVLGAINLRLIP